VLKLFMDCVPAGKRAPLGGLQFLLGHNTEGSNRFEMRQTVVIVAIIGRYEKRRPRDHCAKRKTGSICPHFVRRDLAFALRS
jgi:hypothetical protein